MARSCQDCPYVNPQPTLIYLFDAPTIGGVHTHILIGSYHENVEPLIKAMYQQDISAIKGWPVVGNDRLTHANFCRCLVQGQGIVENSPTILIMS